MGKGGQREKFTLYLDYQRYGFFTAPYDPQSRIGISIATVTNWELTWGDLSQDTSGFWHWEPLTPHANVLYTLTAVPNQQITEINIYTSFPQGKAILALVQPQSPEQFAVTSLLTALPAERFRTYFCDAPRAHQPEVCLQSVLHAVYQHYWYNTAAPPITTIESAGITASMSAYTHFYTITLDSKLTCFVHERTDGTFRVMTHPTQGRDEHITRRAVLTVARRHFGWSTQATMNKALGNHVQIIIVEEHLQGPLPTFGRIITRLWRVHLGEEHTCFVGKRLHPHSRSLTGTYVASLSKPPF